MPVVINTYTTALLGLVVNMGTIATRDGGHTLHIQREYIYISSMSTSPSSPNSNVHSPSSSPKASVSLILAFSGSSPYAFTCVGSASTCTIELHQLTVASLIRSVLHYDIRLAILELA
jgi:hypothetical protein